VILINCQSWYSLGLILLMNKRGAKLTTRFGTEKLFINLIYKQSKLFINLIYKFLGVGAKIFSEYPNSGSESKILKKSNA